MKDFNVGLLGLGTVGGGTARILLDNHEVISERVGRRIVLSRAVDIDTSLGRSLGLPEGMLSKRIEDIVDNPSIDVMVELIGGIEPARTFILRAIAAGKHVVTANKKLLAVHWEEIIGAAAAKGVEVFFEASVGGGIPIIRSLREGLAANRIGAIYGIVNGTSNYILSRMTETGADFKAALEEARQAGYAEADPSLDVDGIDAAHKICILATLAFGGRVPFDAIHTEGISRIEPLDISFAREFGYRIKLLAVAKEKDDRIDVRVHPTMIPAGQLLATVNGVFNAICVTGDAVGTTMFYGRGAGRMPTGSAIVGDLMSLAAMGKGGCSLTGAVPHETIPASRLMPIDDVVNPFYIRLGAMDRPGVLSAVAGVLGKYGISISSVIQKGRWQGGPVPIVMMTHEARESQVRQAMAEIGALPEIPEAPVVIRVEEGF
jgi:homoserine dehydrogenase